MVDGRCTEIQDIAEFNKYMRFVKYRYTWNRDPIGIMVTNASTAPTVQRIDKNDNPFNPDPDFFYNHELYYWPKVLLPETGIPIYGNDYKGSNLDLTGATGDIMAYIPNGQYYYKYESDADVQIFKYAPFDSNHRFFKDFPHCFAGGGEKRDHFFYACYKAGLKDDNGTLKLNSCSGVQPWTGGQMRSVPFTAGNTAFTVGETITGATSGATGTVVSYHISSGDWSVGTAVGVVYIRNHGVNVSTATAFASGEAITRAIGSATTSGVSTALTLTLDQALAYAANKGAGWTISSIWGTAWIQGLLYTMWGTRNSQIVGKGIVNRPAGAGYAGLLNGADNIDINIDEHGNGSGDGIDGYRSISTNNLQDLWGNVDEFTSGINIMTDGSYRLTNRNGTGAIAGVLASGSYETGVDITPLSNGFISRIQTDEMGATAFIPKNTPEPGSDSTNFCDFFYPSHNDPSIIISGGYWPSNIYAGISFRDASYNSSVSGPGIGARLEYIPQS